MDRDAILARLRAAEPALRAKGVARLALFGSRARGDDRPDSDIDIMIELAPEARIGVYRYIDVVQAIEDLFPLPVDVSNVAAQKPHVRPAAERDAIHVF